MASVIKHEHVPEHQRASAAREFNVQDVQVRAQQAIDSAREQARAIIAEAEAAANEIRERAKEQGIADAKNEITKQVEAKAQQLSDTRCKTAVASCEKSLDQLATSTTEWLGIWRQQTITLACQIAEKLVRHEMSINEEVLHGWLEEAIVATRDMREVRIIINPDDFTVVGRFLQHLAKAVPQAANAEIVPDPKIEIGGCIVRNSDGEIDQQLSTQLERLVEQLK